MILLTRGAHIEPNDQVDEPDLAAASICLRKLKGRMSVHTSLI